MKYYKNGWTDPPEEVYRVFKDGSFEYYWVGDPDDYELGWKSGEWLFEEVIESYKAKEISEQEAFVLLI